MAGATRARHTPVAGNMDVRARSPRMALTTVWLPLSLTWLALALRVVGLTSQSLWRDEVDTLMFAARPLSQALQMFRQPGQNGPLFFLALHPWLRLAGHSEFALRFPSTLTSVLAVPACYVLISRLAGHKPAALSALLLAVAPYSIWYGQEAKMYALLTLLAPASLWLTVEAARRGRWWRWTLLYLTTTLMIYTHLLAVLIVPVQILWLLILPTAGRPGRRWQMGAAYLAALCLPYLPLAIWQADMWLSTFETGHRFVPLGDILLVLTVVFSLGVSPGHPTAIGLLPFTLALVAGVGLWLLQEQRRVRRKSEPKHRTIAPPQLIALLLIWLLLPPLMIYGVSLGIPIFTERYLIWVMPAFLALIALGLIALVRAWRPLGLLVLAAVLALNVSGIASQARLAIKSDFRSAAQFVVQRLRPRDLLIYQIPYIRYTFTYYSSGRNDPNDTSRQWLDGPYTNRGMSEAEVDAWMTTGIGAAPAAWLIASETPMWDERGLTEQWLETHGTVDTQAAFARVTVTRYQFQEP